MLQCKRPHTILLSTAAKEMLFTFRALYSRFGVFPNTMILNLFIGLVFFPISASTDFAENVQAQTDFKGILGSLYLNSTCGKQENYY